MSRIVFAGPSLPPDIAADHPDIDFRPPARQGDVYKAALEGSDAIGIVDGYFEGVPSVWHKEILFALSRGIQVYGAASMGALRAAELDTHGMIGVGAIYAAYRDGAYEDDDEVAVLHGPAEAGFPAVTVPMVNVRATLDAAVAAGVISRAEADKHTAAAKAVHYKDRTWATAFSGASDLATWASENAVDQKRVDALALLAAIKDDVHDRPTGQDFAWTFAFERAARVWSNAHPASNEDHAVLVELVLQPTLYAELRTAARLRRLADAEPAARSPDRAALLSILDKTRRDQGLFSRSVLDEWLAENGLDEAGLERVLAGAARLDGAERGAGPLAPHLLAEIKLTGVYAKLRARAQDKARQLEASASVSLLPPVLLAWFEQRMADHPDHIDHWRVDFDLADNDAIYRVLADEYLYWQLCGDGDGDEGPGNDGNAV